MNGKNIFHGLLSGGFALLLVLSSSVATAAPVAPAAQQVLKLEQAWANALSSKTGTAFLNKLLSTNYIDVSWQGRIRTKAELLKDNAAPSIESQTLSDVRVRVFGDTAIVTGLNTAVGKHRAWMAKLRFTDVYVRQAGQWKAVSSQETLLKHP